MKSPEMYGWVGRILRVDLTSGKIRETPTSDYVPQLIGGRGIGAMIYWEEVPPECEAFDPENRLIITTGPATGTLATASSRFYIGNKSPAPLKECYTYSVTGGHWGPCLKFAGYDGIVINGKASEPVYIWIHDGEVEIRCATHLWGMATRNTYTELIRIHGQKTRALVIGPAGENLCREAVIGTDASHATGIGGAGAVMGSKNLKAIAVNGTGAVKVARPKKLIALSWHYFRLLNRQPGEKEYPAISKSLTYYMYHRPHISHCPGHPKMPTDPAVFFKNIGLDDPISLMAEPIKKGLLKLKWAGCHGCPVCCILCYQSKDPNIPSGAGKCNGMQSWPAYEWAKYKKVIGIPSIWFNSHVEDLGLSITNTCGYHFYWFFDLVKLGVLNKENTGVPVDKPWTLEFIKGILEKVAYRKGIGNLLAEGQERFLKSLSDDNPAVKPIYEETIWHPGYFVHWTTDGQPGTAVSSTVRALINATETRSTMNRPTGEFGAKSGMNISGLTDEQKKELLKRGNLKYFGAEDASDLPGEPKTWKNKVRTAIVCQNMSINMDCVPMCGWANCPPFYSRYTPDKLGDPDQGLKMYSAITGIDMTHDKMMEAMDRVFNIERCIHVREGRRREHDIYPDSIYRLDSWKWTSKEEFEKVIDDYYIARGWDPSTGLPKRSTLKKLGLKKIANELKSKFGVTIPS
ncbi:aldehyde ferredoxin oxidoreductase N-terminal domain-containing protein [Chloroflexota bacterium]